MRGTYFRDRIENGGRDLELHFDGAVELEDHGRNAVALVAGPSTHPDTHTDTHTLFMQNTRRPPALP